MESYEKLLLANKSWAKEKTIDDPDFFSRQIDTQNPDFLWIGCSDSRVPPNEITQTKPGEIFIHRNVANLVVNTDVNLLSVLTYAVEHLKVKHVIVCGHYGCGGVNAAMTNTDFKPVLNMWLRNIKDVYRIHKAELDAIADNTERSNRLTELNVKEQLLNLSKTSVIQKAWKERNAPDLHGWIYQLENGLIKHVHDIKAGEYPDSLYQFQD